MQPLTDAQRAALDREWANYFLIKGSAADRARRRADALRFYGRAIRKAKEKNDFSASSLASYEQLLNESFIMKEMNTFQNTLSFLENEKLFSKYPQAISDLLERVMWVGDQPKESLYKTISQGLKKEFFNFQTFKDWLKLRKM